MSPDPRTRPPRALGEEERNVEEGIAQEIAFHLDMRAAALRAQGLSEQDATRAAIQQFGDVSAVRSECVTLDYERLAAMQRHRWADEIWHNLRFAVRAFVTQPLLTGIVTLTLALGIGSTTAIYAVVDALLLRSLPVQRPAELIAIGDQTAVGRVGTHDDPVAEVFPSHVYERFRETTTALTEVAATGRASGLRIRVDSTALEPDRLSARFVSTNYFSVLGVSAALGRTASENDGAPSSPAVTISHAYWQRQFGGRSDVLGRRVLINDVSVTITGVAAAGFTGEVVGSAPDLWIPLPLQPLLMPERPWHTSRETYWLLMIGRRPATISTETAIARIKQELLQIYGAEYPQVLSANPSMPFFIQDGSRGFSRVRSVYGPALITLLAGVGVLLLIVCANIANLLLARGVARARELTVRHALGANRARLIRQLLTESAVLGAVGVVAGIGISWYGSRFLLALANQGAGTVSLQTGVSPSVLLFSSGVGLLAVLLFGAIPAFRTVGREMAVSLRAGTKSLGAGLHGVWKWFSLGPSLVSAQIALSITLVIGATLLAQNLSRLNGVQLGVDRAHLTVVDVNTLRAGLAGDTLLAYADRVQRELSALPEVTGVTFSENGLFSGSESALLVTVPGFDPRTPDDSAGYVDQVGPAFAASLGTALVAGRDFSAADISKQSDIALVNRSFAQAFFGSVDVVGRSFGVDSVTVQIVGVIGDIRDQALTEDPKRRFYLPLGHRAAGGVGPFRILVRTRGEPTLALAAVRRAVASVDSRVTIESAQALETTVQQTINQERMLARLTTGFAVMAMILAALGLYGVIAHAVGRRTGELGLRVALGARPSTLLLDVLLDAGRMLLIGLGAGIPLTLLAIGTLQSHELVADRPGLALFLVGTVAITVASGAAALIPALRASRTPPMTALRSE